MNTFSTSKMTWKGIKIAIFGALAFIVTEINPLIPPEWHTAELIFIMAVLTALNNYLKHYNDK